MTRSKPVNQKSNIVASRCQSSAWNKACMSHRAEAKQMTAGQMTSRYQASARWQADDEHMKHRWKTRMKAGWRDRQRRKQMAGGWPGWLPARRTDQRRSQRKEWARESDTTCAWNPLLDLQSYRQQRSLFFVARRGATAGLCSDGLERNHCRKQHSYHVASSESLEMKPHRRPLKNEKATRGHTTHSTDPLQKRERDGPYSRLEDKQMRTRGQNMTTEWAMCLRGERSCKQVRAFATRFAHVVLLDLWNRWLDIMQQCWKCRIENASYLAGTCKVHIMEAQKRQAKSCISEPRSWNRAADAKQMKHRGESRETIAHAPCLLLTCGPHFPGGKFPIGSFNSKIRCSSWMAKIQRLSKKKPGKHWAGSLPELRPRPQSRGQSHMRRESLGHSRQVNRTWEG